MAEHKRCTKCDALKPVGEFFKESRRPDGLQSRCKVCVSAYLHRWQRENPERVRASRLKQRSSPAYRARENASRAANRDAHNEYHRAYRAANRERINEIGAAYHERAKIEKPEQIAARSIRRHQRERAAGRITKAQKRAIWDAHDGRCYICHRDAEQYDHVRPLAAGGTNDPANIRPICAACNARKGSAWPVDFDELRARIYIEYRAEDESLVPAPATESLQWVS